MTEVFKRAVRIVEAALTPRRSTFTYLGRDFHSVRSIWWHDAHQASFDAEIPPYFTSLTGGRQYRGICDAGAAVGLFSIAAAVHFPTAHIYAFEPSRRQRIMLRRNLRLNELVRRVEVVPVGLWRSDGVLDFRTIGAMSALRLATDLPLDFKEHVPVISLDEWTRRRGVAGIDLIKMDIEGAELEALYGAREVLRRDRPDLLIQAYHLREGTRTFERCAAQLRSLGYEVREDPAGSGLLHAIAT